MIKLIACDLDRTLLPNGHEPNDGGLSYFAEFIKNKDFTIIYVSGRNLKLFEEARSEFSLPLPDYFFGDVGTMLYKKEGDSIITDDSWFSYIQENTPKWDWDTLKNLTSHPLSRLQEDWRQNAYKLSYYIDDLSQGESVTQELRDRIDKENIKADVVYSVDPLKNVGLVDILPSVATKVTAVDFLRKRLNLKKEEVVYCGDSGNDTLPLTYGYKSIVVANASNEIKKEVQEKVPNNKDLYIAKGNELLNGNYASGVLEGLVYFGVIKEAKLAEIVKKN